MSELAKIDKLKTQLSQSENIVEVKTIRVLAQTLAKEAKKAKNNDVLWQATAVQLDAERMMGERLITGFDSGMFSEGGRPSETCTIESTGLITLPDIGISRNESSLWQRLAKLNVDDYEEAKHKAIDSVLTGTAYKKVVYRMLAGDKDSVAVPVMPDDKFQTIVIDPPWQMQKIDRDEHGRDQVGFEYPMMSLEEIGEFVPMKVLPADNCHLYCWTTQKYLPATFKLFQEWDFKYVFTMTWHKNGGFQPFGLPQYNSEFVVFGRRGGLSFDDTKAFNTCFSADRREHSRKPDEFYDLVRCVSPAPRIDIFSRELRDGFDQYGNQEDKFATA